jgi:hypothetical protein
MNMAKGPGIDRRIKKLASLMPGNYIEGLVQAVKELTSSRRLLHPKKATREMAKSLLEDIIKAEEALRAAKGYLLACLTSKEANQYTKPRTYPYEKEEAAGDRGC